MPDEKTKILEFIKKQRLMVLSTIDGTKSESAVVAFAQTNDLEIIFGTFSTYRKYKNLQTNKNVSLVIGWEEDGISVQYEGVAEEVTGEERDKCREIQLNKIPESKKFANLEQQRYFKISPKWIRYSDFSTDPPSQFEIKF